MLLNQFVRYAEIADIITDGKFDTILEVGSGTNGVGEYIPGSFVGCDLSFRDCGMGRRTIHKRMKPVEADGLSLPFRNRSFGLVISSDVLEHIQPALRAKAVRELCRVAICMVIISFPCGERAFDCDRRLWKFYTRRRKSIPEWLYEHLRRGFPTVEKITSLLSEWGLNFHVMGNENLWLHYLIMVLESYGSLKFKLAAIAELFNPRGDVIEHLSPKGRIAQCLLRSLSPLKSLVNVDPTYRKIFVIHV